MGKHKDSSWGRVLGPYAMEFARQSAMAIMESVDSQEKYCTDPGCRGRIRYLKAVENAAIVMEVGQGRRSSVVPEPPCSAVVAAEARMAAGAR